MTNNRLIPILYWAGRLAMIKAMEQQNFNMEIIKVPTEEWLGPDAVIDKLVKNLKKIINTSKVNKEEIIGIGIGAAGLVNSRKGLVIFSPNLDRWDNIKLK